MRALKALLPTVAAALVLGSCDTGTQPQPQRIDHLEIAFAPIRSSYPVPDTVRPLVRGFSKEGTWAPIGTPTWRSLSPTLASIDSGGLIHTLGKGDATIAVEVDGVTAQAQLPIRGILHQGYVLDHNETWLVADTPHVVERALGVGDIFGANSLDTVVLRIEPGATVRFRPGAGLSFGDIEPGALVIPPGDSVLMEDDQPSPASPSWLGLKFHRSRSQLRHLTLRHCGQDYPFDNPGACIIADGADLLIDGVTIDHGRNGLILGFGASLAPGTRDLSVVHTTGYVATIAPHLVAAFPRGGAFTGNDGTEILITNGRVLDSVTWTPLGLPLRLTGGVSFEGPGNPVLTLPAGFHLRVDPGGGFSFAAGGLVAGDLAGAPVVLESTGEGWLGLAITHAGGSALRNVVLQDCGGSQGYPGSACLTFGGGDSGLLVQDVAIRGSRSAGVTMTLGGTFNPASRNLTITQSATYPLGVYARDIPSIPDGDYRFNGIDAIDVIGDYGIGHDSVAWRDLGVPYRFRSGLGVDSTLVLEPGVTIEVGVGMRVTAGFGNLVAVGTASDPIVFRSVTPGVPGSWMGIELGAGLPGPGTRLEHVVIADAGAGSPGYAGALRLGADPGGVLHNSTIVRSSSCGIVLFNGHAWTDDYTDPTFGNTFVDIAGPLRCQPPA